MYSVVYSLNSGNIHEEACQFTKSSKELRSRVGWASRRLRWLTSSSPPCPWTSRLGWILVTQQWRAQPEEYFHRASASSPPTGIWLSAVEVFSETIDPSCSHGEHIRVDGRWRYDIPTDDEGIQRLSRLCLLHGIVRCASVWNCEGKISGFVSLIWWSVVLTLRNSFFAGDSTEGMEPQSWFIGYRWPDDPSPHYPGIVWIRR